MTFLFQVASFSTTVNYPKIPGFFNEQNAGFSAQIHSVTLTKTWFKKRHVIFLFSSFFLFNILYVHCHREQKFSVHSVHFFKIPINVHRHAISISSTKGCFYQCSHTIPSGFQIHKTIYLANNKYNIYIMSILRPTYRRFHKTLPRFIFGL